MRVGDAYMDRNLALELARVSEAAALSASLQVGRGNEKEADQVAVNAMRKALNVLDIDGTVVIGEGERDEAPMLFIGEKVGTCKGPKVDIALDPLEGTTITATGGPNALAVVAMAEAGGFLHAPDVYMEKIAVGVGLPDNLIDLDVPVAENLKNLAKAKGAELSDLQVCILERPRHQELIARVRETGARIMLIGDGDVSGVIATSQPESGVDMYIGTGGARPLHKACRRIDGARGADGDEQVASVDGRLDHRHLIGHFAEPHDVGAQRPGGGTGRASSFCGLASRASAAHGMTASNSKGGRVWVAISWI